MDPTTPHISVIVLHYKNPADTIACLKSLRASTYTNYSVYLVYNGCTHEDIINITNSINNWDKLITIRNKTNTGFAEGNNIAIRLAIAQHRPTYVFTLNNDTIITPDCLEQLVNAAIKQPRTMIQALMFAFDKKTIDKTGIRLTKLGIPFDIKTTTGQYHMCCPSAGAALYPVTMLIETAYEKTVADGFQTKIIRNFFDPTYFAYTEDLDLGIRGRLAGYSTTCLMDAIVYHKGSASTAPMSEFAVYHTYRNLIWTIKKLFPKTWIRTHLLQLVIGQCAIAYSCFRRNQLGIYFRALKDALTTNPTPSKNTSVDAAMIKQLIDKHYL